MYTTVLFVVETKYCISFNSWCSRHIHNMKIISEMEKRFLVSKKKINIHFIDCLFFSLSCRLSAQFCPQLPHGCFALCCLNMSFIHIPLLKPKALLAVSADLVNPWISRNISAYFWRCDVFWDLREIAYYCFVPVTPEIVRIKLTWKFCKLYKT